jgi:hypothetical protein
MTQQMGGVVDQVHLYVKPDRVKKKKPRQRCRKKEQMMKCQRKKNQIMRTK